MGDVEDKFYEERDNDRMEKADIHAREKEGNVYDEDYEGGA
jgi:hypothetical protein